MNSMKNLLLNRILVCIAALNISMAACSAEKIVNKEALMKLSYREIVEKHYAGCF